MWLAQLERIANDGGLISAVEKMMNFKRYEFLGKTCGLGAA